MDEYELFVQTEKEKAKKKGRRGQYAPDVAELIERAIEYARSTDEVNLIGKQVIEIAVRGYWKAKLEGRTTTEN